MLTDSNAFFLDKRNGSGKGANFQAITTNGKVPGVMACGRESESRRQREDLPRSGKDQADGTRNCRRRLITPTLKVVKPVKISTEGSGRAAGLALGLTVVVKPTFVSE